MIAKGKSKQTKGAVGKQGKSKTANEDSSLVPSTPERTNEVQGGDRRTERGRSPENAETGKDMSPMLATARSAGASKQPIDSSLQPDLFSDHKDFLSATNEVYEPLSGTVCRWAEGIAETTGDEWTELWENAATVLRIAHWSVDRVVAKAAEKEHKLIVSDGTQIFFVFFVDLFPLEASREDAARILANAEATTSPRCETVPPDRWDWLTPEGLSRTEVCEVPVPQTAVPHLVGKGGRTIREAEDRLGIILDIMDANSGREAVVSIVGPPAKVAVAAAVLPILAKGSRTVLSRLPMDNGDEGC